jgi:transposase-like protein
MCWMTINCPRCGSESTLEAMTERPVSGPLPMGQFQCPICNYAFQRREVEPGSVYEINGQRLYIPGKIGLVPCEAVL